VVAGTGEARAELPLPSYRDHLSVEAWYRVNTLLEQARVRSAASEPEANVHQALRQAVAVAQRFEREVVPTSGLAYLQGLAYRLMGDEERAQSEYRRSIDLDPDRATDAWFDLGEMYLGQGRWAEADRAFAEVSRLLVTGPQAWRGPLRRAEVAAWQGDPVGFESALIEALRRGFDLRRVAHEPQWRTFAKNPKIRPALERLILGYADRSTLDQVRAEP
jgi:tetratricopeptide (TPR) repeat protein